MDNFKDFSDMRVWQKSSALLLKSYNIIKRFPPEVKYALADDLRQSANSVVHNIAEGYCRFEPKDKTRFYKISRGGSYEAMSPLLVANAQNYTPSSEIDEIINGYKEVIEELNAIIYTFEK